jgi:hypothetical protein
LFQANGLANGLTMAKHISNESSNDPCIPNNFGFSIPNGASFAITSTGNGFLGYYGLGKDVMVYSIDTNNDLIQHEYTVTADLEF